MPISNQQTETRMAGRERSGTRAAARGTCNHRVNTRYPWMIRETAADGGSGKIGSQGEQKTVGCGGCLSGLLARKGKKTGGEGGLGGVAAAAPDQSTKSVRFSKREARVKFLERES